jgi:hypothetical protein
VLVIIDDTRKESAYSAVVGRIDRHLSELVRSRKKHVQSPHNQSGFRRNRRRVWYSSNETTTKILRDL